MSRSNAILLASLSFGEGLRVRSNEILLAPSPPGEGLGVRYTERD